LREIVKAAALAALLFFPRPALAQGCTPPRYVTGMAMTAMATNTVSVPATIDGVPKTMLLDTGGMLSQLTPAARDEFKLSEQRSPERLFDIAGNVSSTLAQVPEFRLGALTFDNLALQINASPILASTVAGLVSNDLLMPYDADLDFAGGRLNLFLPGSCAEAKLYWPTAPLTIVPFQFVDAHITINARLDGQPIRAVIDTGAPFTTLNLKAAERLFNLAPGELHLNVGVGQGDTPLNIYAHRFSIMTFEGVTVSNPIMLVVPIQLGEDKRLFHWRPSDVPAPDLIVGMDILRTLHLYISYRDKKIYITRADGDAAARLLPPLADAGL
jgi:hypothetical protein